MKRKKGFTLVEILVSMAIMAITITGALKMLNSLAVINEGNDAILAIMNHVQGVMDEVRNVPFSDLSALYNNKQFQVAELQAKGITHQGLITVTNIEPGYLDQVRIVVCWRQKDRVIGEDENLNANLDAGEDQNTNGVIDSPCQISSIIRAQ
ncbi:MAG: prepilin-type N-terminal cleavage/methylation domain-containing protein [Candidatus Omnitrophica bacterium]|nr:prepilin-type N-terminal cleavage/methylation domain-containing protein [Candidatus Omnitrophota bacterium]